MAIAMLRGRSWELLCLGPEVEAELGMETVGLRASTATRDVGHSITLFSLVHATLTKFGSLFGTYFSMMPHHVEEKET